MNASWKITLSAALAVYFTTLLTFLVLMYCAWGLSPSSFAYAAQLGALWGLIGACPIGFIMHHIESHRSTSFGICFAVW